VSEEIVRADVTHQPNTAQGNFDRHAQLEPPERVIFTGKTSWFGGLAFKIKARLQARSPQSTGFTTMLLGLTGCAITGTAHLVGGVSGQTALIVGACVPVGTYVLIRLVSHWTR
jgi:hypothetical protein